MLHVRPSLILRRITAKRSDLDTEADEEDEEDEADEEDEEDEEDDALAPRPTAAGSAVFANVVVLLLAAPFLLVCFFFFLGGARGGGPLALISKAAAVGARFRLAEAAVLRGRRHACWPPSRSLAA